MKSLQCKSWLVGLVCQVMVVGFSLPAFGGDDLEPKDPNGVTPEITASDECPGHGRQNEVLEKDCIGDQVSFGQYKCNCATDPRWSEYGGSYNYVSKCVWKFSRKQPFGLPDYGFCRPSNDSKFTCDENKDFNQERCKAAAVEVCKNICNGDQEGKTVVPASTSKSQVPPSGLSAPSLKAK